MEIGARLHHVQLLSASPADCAAFYGRIYAMDVAPIGSDWGCTGPERRLLFKAGASNQLGHAAYAFESAGELNNYRSIVKSRADVLSATSPWLHGDVFTVSDPDGNKLLFGVRGNASSTVPVDAPPARLQHLALRSSNPAKLVDFYHQVLQFKVSDRVHTNEGELRACFLRTDPEHHALAIFHAANPCYDHLSFETGDALQVRDWADRIARHDARIVWGIGRHGPGNDIFFMIRDPEGNLAEISAELEQCDPAREEGRWPHAERTLNLWGAAIMRS